MVAGRSFLIILLLLLPVLAAAQGSCLKCHPSHYAEAGSCTHCHRGDPRTDRQELAHHDLIAGRFSWFAIPESPVTRSGIKLLEQAGCRRCHRSGDKGNTLASDLDRLLPAARPQEVLQSIRQPVLFMPDFAFTEPAAGTLVNTLFAHSAQAEKPAGETPLVVHFEGVERVENAFDKHCGGCHRVLTRRWGGLGSGLVGPNLSGLTSEFYPMPFREGEPWTAERLKKWLENPRHSPSGAHATAAAGTGRVDPGAGDRRAADSFDRTPGSKLFAEVIGTRRKSGKFNQARPSNTTPRAKFQFQV